MSKIFNIRNTNITFTDEMVKYNNLRNYFSNLGEEMSKEFRTEYINRYEKIEDVSENALDLGYYYISKCIDEALKFIVSYDIFTVDKDTFISKYYQNYCVWEDNFEAINEKYLSIVMEQAELDQYRNDRRQNRARWQGGGFGLQGAIGGALQAGALNMTTNVLHGAANITGKLVSSIGASGEKKSLFENPDTLNTLVSGVYYNCYIIHLSIIDALYSNGVNNIGKYITTDNIEKARVLFNNYKDGLIDESKKDEVVRAIIISNPYIKEVYEYLIYEIGDEKGEIEVLVTFLGINVCKYKNKLLKKYFESLPFDTEDSTLQSKEKFELYSRHLGIKDYEYYINKINETIILHDKNIRTVDGIEFETREEAYLANEELKIIQDIISVYGEQEEDSILKAIDEIEEKVTTIVKNKYIERLNFRLVKAIAVADKVNLDKKFNINSMITEKDTDTALQELENIIIRSKEVLKNKVEEVEEKRIQIIELNDRAFIENILNEYLFLSIEDVNKALNEVSLTNIRTVKIKEEKIDLLTNSGEKLIKRDIKKVAKAIKYEEYLSQPKEEKVKKERKGVFGFISKAISTGVDTVKEKIVDDQEEAWNFVTKNGNIPLDDIKSKIK